jgi:predicted enzyme related to lactoylglutathione lyase
MANHVRHFAVQADDVERARLFYEADFGWTFEPWGPPDFFLIHTGSGEDRGLQGALQRRQEALSGTGMRGFECTIGVDDLDEAMTAIAAHGGTVISSPFTIEGVGRLVFMNDPEGNRVGVMQYEPGYPI